MLLWALFGTLALLPAACCDEQLTISLLRNAYESHIDRCKSGQMNFAWSNLHVPENDHFLLSGFVEWAEDYLYFKGNMHHQRPGAKGREVLDHDVCVLFSGGHELKRSQAGSQSRFKFVRLEISPGQHNKMAVWRPNTFLYLVHSGPLDGTTNPWNLLQPAAQTPRSEVPFQRSIETRGALIDLHTKFPTDTAKRVFDLQKGGLCTELHLTRHRKDGEHYIHATRNWVCLRDDAWFPESSRVVCSRDQQGQDPVRIVECKIDAFEPIGQREFSGPATLSSFGLIPKGAVVSQRFADGSMKEWTQGVDSEEDVELQLRNHVELILKGSFMDAHP
jgi:hypothetical protein